MVFADWTFSGSGSGTLNSHKYAGISSYRSYIHKPCGGGSGSARNYLQHDTFSETQAQVIAWCYAYYNGQGPAYQYINHSSYVPVRCILSAYHTWERHKVSFWYSSAYNRKQAQDERWTGSEWVLTGAPIDCGVGAPDPGTIILEAYVSCSYGNYTTGYVYFDELDVNKAT